ncbi:BrnA antitoxin family protein [Methylopila sp. M107]|uniref:BrnA antitoxin family protein n=1 Tax=Methylopila sp. M107 TaxID=1101190 RepID=UPI00039DB75C|nr:BrnA antitoxin family protein [Methylopila sp. M107]
MARRPSDPRAAAEAAFKPARPVAPPLPPRSTAAPGAREQVTLRIDSDVLELFQEDGAGWQDRINAALRETVRAQLAARSGDGAIRVDELSGENDDGAG